MNTYTAISSKQNGSFWLSDLIYISLAAIYALLACYGILAISANGIVLDSDLQTYAQGMAGQNYPELFINDPVLQTASQANSIPNLQRWLAQILSGGGNYGAGLLRAGAIAIFFFYCFWYALGRWLFKYPSLAAALSLLAGITVWVGWGTFWGITHSDPVPRTFFAAIFPLLLLIFLLSLQRPILRPFCMLAAGAAIWVHGISALNCGAMFFLAFVFIKPTQSSWPVHLNNSIISLIFFFIPVLKFLWPSLNQNTAFSDAELNFFREFMSYRWHNDYSGFWIRFCDFFKPSNTYFIIFICGILGWIITSLKGNPQERQFARSLPFFVLALLSIALFSWAESTFAEKWGRLPMGHELVRGLRFLVPLAWISAVGGLGLFLGKTGRRVFLLVVFGLIASFNTDRQYMAAQYELGKLLHISLPLSSIAIHEKNDADSYARLMAEMEKFVPENGIVFTDTEAMAIRYAAKRPVYHIFKDGYAHFYNKDYEKSRKWLDMEKLMRKNMHSLAQAWLDSGAPWFLGKNISDKQYFTQFGKILYDKDGWILIRRDGGLLP